MPSGKKKLSLTEKNLTRRYLMWCYKTTKEDLDRIDRYFTQLVVDARVLEILSKHGKDDEQRKKIDEFKQYMDTKEKTVLLKKYSNIPSKVLQPDYWYLRTRLAALEQVIIEFLGKKALKSIQSLYENEMTRRILEAKEHP